MNKTATWTTALATLVCTGSAAAHHSNISIDASTPVWVKGTVVRYEIANPHTMIELEEATRDGQVKRWTVQGPNPRRIENMDVDKSFLSVGDVVEVCGFIESQSPTRRRRRRHVDRKGSQQARDGEKMH